MITLKTDREMKMMREANRIIAVVLNDIEELIVPGVSTYELDQWAEKTILRLNALPAFKGYGGFRPFPATLCTSVNEEVVHGIPSETRILKEGDIISIDVGSVYEGYYGDGARTYPVGQISEQNRKLLDTCKESLERGVEAALKGNRVSDISKAVEKAVRKDNFEIVRDLTGHGIGKNLHEEPQVLNYDCGIKGAKLKKNMTICIEPMITSGGFEVFTLDDHWTVVTSDGSMAAHYEYAVAITDNGPEILTRL